MRKKNQTAAASGVALYGRGCPSIGLFSGLISFLLLCSRNDFITIGILSSSSSCTEDINGTQRQQNVSKPDNTYLMGNRAPSLSLDVPKSSRNRRKHLLKTILVYIDRIKLQLVVCHLMKQFLLVC